MTTNSHGEDDRDFSPADPYDFRPEPIRFRPAAVACGDWSFWAIIIEAGPGPVSRILHDASRIPARLMDGPKPEAIA